MKLPGREAVNHDEQAQTGYKSPPAVDIENLGRQRGGSLGGPMSP